MMLPDLKHYSQSDLLTLAAKAVGITWPQNLPAGARGWNPAENSADCLEMVFNLGMNVDPLGYTSIPEWRQSLLVRAAYIGLHT